MKTVYVVLGTVIFLLLIRLLSSDGGISDYLSLQKKLGTLEGKVQQLESRNADLKKEVYVLQSQKNSVETIARQKLGMIGQDEAFVKVIELKPETQNADDAAKTTNPTSSKQVTTSVAPAATSK